jgi:hypothetical protein
MIKFLHCRDCGQDLEDPTHTLAGYCWDCREQAAIEARQGWCVLTPHKQGAMFFTAEYAREAAVGINSKGGMVR